MNLISQGKTNFNAVHIMFKKKYFPPFFGIFIVFIIFILFATKIY